MSQTSAALVSTDQVKQDADRRSQWATVKMCKAAPRDLERNPLDQEKSRLENASPPIQRCRFLTMGRRAAFAASRLTAKRAVGSDPDEISPGPNYLSLHRHRRYDADTARR